MTRTPTLSIVVTVYNMRREAPRTLRSLTPEYQGVDADTYEVIVVDNGSSEPLDEREVRSIGPNFRCLSMDRPAPSPVPAMNFGAAAARGRWLGLMIDGARILTPGVISLALRAVAAYDEPVVATLGFHLGPDVQYRSVARGYCQREEDRLLAQIGWPADGYRLFEISSLGGSSRFGWFLPIAESNCVFLSRGLWARLGGYDERFAAPGGGLANLDFYKRACESAGVQPVVLLGEGTFHQLHGGASTGLAAGENERRWDADNAFYASLRGEGYRCPTRKPVFLGSVPPPAEALLRLSLEIAERARREGSPAPYETVERSVRPT